MQTSSYCKHDVIGCGSQQGSQTKSKYKSSQQRAVAFCVDKKVRINVQRNVEKSKSQQCQIIHRKKMVLSVMQKLLKVIPYRVLLSIHRQNCRCRVSPKN